MLAYSFISFIVYNWFFKTKSYTGFISSNMQPIKIVLVMSEQYPWYLHPISINIGSAIFTALSPGCQCGSELFSPIATTGLKANPSAPFFLKNISISNAISFSVVPIFINSNKWLKHLSVISHAFFILSISSLSFTALNFSIISSVSDRLFTLYFCFK